MTRPTLTQIRLDPAKTVTTDFLAATTGADHKAIRRQYATSAEETPVMIRMIGLGQAIAVLTAKDGGSRRLAAALAEWLLHGCPYSVWRSNQPLAGDDTDKAKALLGKIAAETNAANYRFAQAEAIDYAAWLKRLAQAFVKEQD